MTRWATSRWMAIGDGSLNTDLLRHAYASARAAVAVQVHSAYMLQIAACLRVLCFAPAHHRRGSSGGRRRLLPQVRPALLAAAPLRMLVCTHQPHCCSQHTCMTKTCMIQTCILSRHPTSCGRRGSSGATQKYNVLCCVTCMVTPGAPFALQACRSAAAVLLSPVCLCQQLCSFCVCRLLLQLTPAPCLGGSLNGS
jgi:hypothetical protein